MRYLVQMVIPGEDDIFLEFRDETERYYWMTYIYSNRNEQWIWIDIPTFRRPFLQNFDLVSTLIPLDEEELDGKTVSTKRWR